MRPFLAALGLIVAAAVAGLVVLWPGDTEGAVGAGIAGERVSGRVTAVEEEQCPGAPDDPASCMSASVEVSSGPDEGRNVPVQLGSGGLAPDLDPGDEIRMTRSEPGAGTPAAYSFADFDRGVPMLILAIVFASVVVVFGRIRGALSLVGLSLSLLVVLSFIVPAILDGEPALLVAVTGSLTVMLLTVSLAHGLGPKSVAAMLGTAASLILVALLALVATEASELTGLASEEASVLSLGDSDLSLEGLLLAGMVVGALGVLDDVTVSQASTVLALRRANRNLRGRELYRRAVEVGRDHVSATVNTLVLAYVGAALPVLLIFSSSQVGFLDAINTELVAKEVVAMLVGSIGLIAAVPITTAIAATMSTPVPANPARPVAADPH